MTQPDPIASLPADRPLAIVILAAGKGTRMKSALHKVLHPIAGRAMLLHLMDSAAELAPERTVVVVGSGRDQLERALGTRAAIAVQDPQLGTGHAVQQAAPALEGFAGDVLVLYGDVPFVRAATMRTMLDRLHADDAPAVVVLGFRPDDPLAYGRVIAREGRVHKMVEFKDASAEERAADLCNSGLLAARAEDLFALLGQVGNANAQGEYYLTDIVAMAADAQGTIHTAQPAHLWEVDGVNDKLQLSALERLYQRVQAERLMRAGVTMTDPARFDLRGELLHGNDVVIEPNVMIEGRVEVGSNVLIGANCQLRNCVIGDNVIIKPNSLIDEARVGRGAEIGPFARLRPGTELDDDVHIGNFVEVKKSRLGVGTKANHLAYIGDADVGARVNIGAGSITCNYDGANKHQTVIGDDAFIGTNSSLIAPVTIGKGSTTGAGSAISRNVPDHTLAVARGKQVVIEGWQRPKKNK